MPPVGANPADVDGRPLDHRPASLRQVSAPAALAAVSALSLPRIKSFSNQFLIVDSFVNGSGGETQTSEIYGNSKTAQSIHFRHQNTADVACLDGHVEDDSPGEFTERQRETKSKAYYGYQANRQDVWIYPN